MANYLLAAVLQGWLNRLKMTGLLPRKLIF